ncbi:MAG: hypothetical protein CMD92_04315 [Gammaproteobacteria bacterium]|nr:hypothetical protein [Gammaproteobacteria bacterium]HBW83523.1 hypothetical protein [Gammaproteobacteria bacterium]|tara:strand:+ start:717 stop:1316 length:600 start_codon:yes stop_codon:yes gene_type:complete
MANLLTFLRLLLALPVGLALANDELLPASALALLLLIAIASDILDGKVARSFGTASARGQIFDHATDFIFVTAGLAGAASANLVPEILPILISLAFSQYVLDSHFLYRQKSLRMSSLGRWNGVFYFGPLLLIAGARLLEKNQWAAETALTILSLLAWALVISTVISILDRAMAPFNIRQHAHEKAREEAHDKTKQNPVR